MYVQNHFLNHCRVIGFYRVPPTAGRLVNVTYDIKRLADHKLAKTFFKSPGERSDKLHARYTETSTCLYMKPKCKQQIISNNNYDYNNNIIKMANHLLEKKKSQTIPESSDNQSYNNAFFTYHKRHNMLYQRL